MVSKWWKLALNVMLEKLAGNNNVEKLLIIMLFEADFNNNNKWLGQAAMKLAEEHNLLAPEQYRSRQNKVAITQCLNKQLFYDYHQFTWQPAALCANDAKSCYDRIVLIIAALSLYQLGAPKSAVHSMIQTLAHLNHHVCTAFGDLEIVQGYDTWKESVAVIGQGNGARSQIWTAVSTSLVNIMCQEGFVMKFICTLLHQHKVLAGLAFVDDTDLIVNSSSNQPAAVIKKMQNSLIMWHGLLWATGCKLVLDKCFWYLVNLNGKTNNGSTKTWMNCPDRSM